jgi:hypothetical protein
VDSDTTKRVAGCRSIGSSADGYGNDLIVVSARTSACRRSKRRTIPPLNARDLLTRMPARA